MEHSRHVLPACAEGSPRSPWLPPDLPPIRHQSVAGETQVGESIHKELAERTGLEAPTADLKINNLLKIHESTILLPPLETPLVPPIGATKPISSDFRQLSAD